MIGASATRRQLLNALGLGAGSLFLPSLLGDRAAAAGPPKRLVIFFTLHGPVYANWRLRAPGLPEKEQDWELPLEPMAEAAFSPTLRPLWRHRKNLLVLDGLAMTSAMADVGTNNHNAGMSHMLAAAKMVMPAGFDGKGNGGGPSVDQIVAGAVAAPGRIKSLHYSSIFQKWSPTFTGPNQPTPAEASPASAFDRLFPTGAAPAGISSDADLARKARPRVLDLVRSEYTALLPRLGLDDRQKLERHRDLVADLETRLRERPSIACNAPARPGGGASVSAKTKLFMQLAAAAMACDLTRVAVIGAGQMTTAEFGAPGGLDVHQDIAHRAYFPNDASTFMTNYYRVHAEQFAELISLFEGMLDSTALLWVTELANGPHDMFRLMAVMAGSAGGAFRPGRYLKYKETEPNPASFGFCCEPLGRAQWLGPAHSKLLVSLMQAMGVDRSSIGITSAVGNSQTAAGASIDLTGPLPRLR